MADFAKELSRAFEMTQKQTEELKNKEDDQEIRRSNKPRTYENNEASNAEEAYRGRPARGNRGRGGRGDYNGEFRGRGEYRGRGAPRGEFRGNTRARGRGRGEYRGRGGYTNTREEPQYQSQDEEISDGPEPLTKNEIAFIDERIAENKDKLAGIVKPQQIEKKIIDLDFDGEKFDEWVQSLLPTDKKYAGLKDFEWNNTVTQEQKNAKRVRKIAYEHIKKEREVKKREYLKEKKIRDEEYAKRKAEQAEKREARKKELAEKRALEKAAKDALKQEQAEEDAHVVEEAKATVDETNASPEDGPKKEKKKRQPKKEKGDSEYQVKAGSKTLTYKVKEDAPKDQEEEEEVIRRKNSDDENSELLRQAATQQMEQEEKLKREKEEQEAKDKAKKLAIAAKERQEKMERDRAAAAAKKAEEEAKKAKDEAAAAKKAADEAKAKAAKKAADDAKAKVATPVQQMPLMGAFPGMATPSVDGKSDNPMAQNQMFMDQQQLIYQQMALHQQMFQQYQAMLAQQMAMQQQMMSQQNGGAGATTTPQVPQMPQMPQMPMAMPGFMPPTGDQAQFPQGFMPMPMMYPQYPATPQQNGTFPGKNEEK